MANGCPAPDQVHFAKDPQMTAYNQYARSSIETADPRTVIVLLYEGMLNFIAQAKSALEENDRNFMSVNINKALKIINHLHNGLDYERGGEIAENLSSLYIYMRDRLTEANIKCDMAMIDEVANLLKPLAEAWAQIARNPQAASVLASAPGTEVKPFTSGQTVEEWKESQPTAPSPAPNGKISLIGRAAYGVR